MSTNDKFNQMLREYFALGYLPKKDQIWCGLVARYWDKVPHKHKHYDELIEIGDENFSVYLANLIKSKRSPILDCIPKDNSWNNYYQPVILGLEHGITFAEPEKLSLFQKLKKRIKKLCSLN